MHTEEIQQEAERRIAHASQTRLLHTGATTFGIA